MRIHQIGSVLLGLGLLTAGCTATSAQTDLAVSGYEAFNSSTTGNGTIQKASNGIGGMVEVRHIQTPWIGYEMSYSVNPADQSVSPQVGSCGYRCQNPPEKLTVYAHEVALNWVVTHPIGSLRPFLLGGLGFYIAAPSNYANDYDANTVVKPAYVFGGGLDWAVSSRIGLRLQMRGNLYKAPNVEQIYSPTGAFAKTFQPMGGVYFHL